MTRLHRVPMRVLIEEIVEGEPPPGDMLPRELDLVERFGVSRGVVRECIRGLEERGLVTVRHGRGATVQDSAEWQVFDPEVFRALTDAPAGAELMSETVECQRMFEVEAAALAAEHASKRDIDDLTRAIESMKSAAPRAPRSEAAAERYCNANLDFHRAVVRASGNRMLARISEPLHRALAAAGGESGNPKRRVSERERVLTAIVEGDAETARSAMAEHLAPRPKPRRGR